LKLTSIEKDKQPSEEILRLFEKTRVAYLSARSDPDEYGGRWRNAVDMVRESYDELDSAGREMKNFIDEKTLDSKEAKDPKSPQAKKIYDGIKLLRYNSDLVVDPFAKRFKGNVLDELMSNPESMLKFVHYALRNDNKALSPELLAIKDMKSDEITEGLEGLDLEYDDISLYIIEHYGDDKDSKKVEKKVKAATDMLDLLLLSRHSEEYVEDLKDIEKAEKSQSDFIVPNKPMYRIFDVEDINELKGFSGTWIVQEKYDGMRIQLHKIDNNIKVFSYNEKDITDKCKEQVKELKEKKYGDCILDAELILFDGDEALHRADTIAHIFQGKYPDAKLRCHVFDIMRHNDENLLDEPLEKRITILFNNYSSHSSDAINFPSKKDTREADNLKDIDEYAKKIMDMPTSEGVVIKDITSTYYIGTKKNPKWIKWKKFVDLDVIVLKVKKTKSNLFSYTVGIDIGATEEEGKYIQEINNKKYMEVGKALNTKIKADVGDIIRVKVDEVKKTGERYTLYSAKVIEIPEVDMPDKVITLELLSQDTKKSLNYDVRALEKGVAITDHIHGEAQLIIKSDLDGFTIYGFEKENLMSKNAVHDLDMWKSKAEEIMKTKQSQLTVAIFNYLKQKNGATPKTLHNYLVKEMPNLYEDILESNSSKIKEWSEQRDGISFLNGKLIADEDKIMQEEEIKKEYKTPEKYRKGKFKVYSRQDDQINIVMKLGDETINWLVNVENEKELFDLFGKAGKYPAEVAESFEREKVIDLGDVELGVQRDGYHEYFLKGNKFQTKLHIRLVPVKGRKMWVAWTGYKQKPADKENDKGKWNIYQDKFNTMKIPR
jgi:ATP-dependent DNA ligase|tara:strand:+ start:847 stop:3336 length:2490 start_codon:yes stop_codon:yes gene_type:complete